MGSHKRIFLAIVALSPLLAACSDGPPTQPEDPNSIEAQIKALFPPGASAQDAALAQIADIRQQITLAATAQARSKTLALVDFTVTSFRDGKLVGGTSAATGNAASRLMNTLYQLVGMAPPNLPDGSLSNDGAAKVVGPEGALIVTPSGAAGVQIPAGTIGEQVLVTVTRLPAPPTPGTGPLPTSLKQYPPYYDFSTFPAVPQFADSVRVGVCQVTDPSNPLYAPEVAHDRLRLAHAVGSTIEVLERVGVSDFLRCTNVTASVALSGGWRTALSALAQRVIGRMTPVSLYAAHGGLGGKVKSFSPFGAVDPGPPQAALSLAVGDNHSCALSVSGAAYCWGTNGSGQLGNGTTTGSLVPVPVSGGLQFAAITAGAISTCALTTQGAAYCWGQNFTGLSSSTPVPLPGNVRFALISMSSTHACALTAGGAAYCAGSNRGGALGNGDTIASATPVPVLGGLTFRTISAGLLHTCAISTDGSGYCWGPDLFLQNGNGGTTQSVALVPTAIAGGLSFTTLTAGATVSCGTTSTDTYCWGRNNFGTLGDGTTGFNSLSTPGKVLGGIVFTSVNSGNANNVFTPVCALTGSGAAYCWGSNDSGQLGTTSALSTCTIVFTGGTSSTFSCAGAPVPVAGGLAFDIVIPGARHTCGLARDGRAYCWGANNLGQLGNGGTAQSNTPVAVAGGLVFP
ncbi:MAG TPA: hypothetical protein VES88_11750 [Gemmatimonadaceae bacterium]|nr:hypothetical protein [Gemmatimonadaceae bacterium]